MLIKKTVLFESHKKLGARFIDFAGWRMPFSYTSSGEEHLNTRQFGGLFDVSHMGELRVQGKEALNLLKKLLPTNIQNLKEGQAQYSALLNYQGGMIDDIIVYCLNFSEEYFLCVNSGRVSLGFEWMKKEAQNYDVSLRDETDIWGLIAVQGPRAFPLCEKIFAMSFSSLAKRFYFQEMDGILFSRTGYTGEEGMEVYLPLERAVEVWELLLAEGKKLSVFPVGLGARDTLRLEMAYLLSGQDFDETRTLQEAGLGWLNRNPEDYIGKKASLAKKGENLRGFILTEPSGIPRKGHTVFSEEGERIGIVTSGAKSPTLEKMIGLAYIKGDWQKCLLEIHGQKVKAHLVKGPFLNINSNKEFKK